MIWYEITPSDTFYFRGAESMDMGSDHSASSLFPPPLSVFRGAIRTTVLRQRGVAFQDFNNGKAPAEITELIGQSDAEVLPFSIIGPLFRKNGEYFLPAPYSWYQDDNKQPPELPTVLFSKICSFDGIKSSKPLRWVKAPEKELKSLGGNWLRAKDLFQNNGQRMPILSPDHFFVVEKRTGIARDQSGMARRGHLYTFEHMRLLEDVSIVIGIDKEVGLSCTGTLFIGAERRFAFYKKIDGPKFRDCTNSNEYLALSPVEANEESNKAVLATGKILYIGGWDLHIGFHKPMKGYFPSGSVFSRKISDQCIELPVNKEED